MSEWTAAAGAKPAGSETGGGAGAGFVVADLPREKMILRQVGSGRLYLFEPVDRKVPQGPAD
jgi:hypothetical protein